MLGFVFSLLELLDDPFVECRDVVGFAAGDETLISNELLVRPLSAGVPELNFTERERFRTQL